MKSGASDPFADDEPTQTQETNETQQTEAQQIEETGDEMTTDSAEQTEPEDVSDVEDTAPSESGDRDTGVTGLSREELPFILRREKVKDERPEVHQLFVQAETHEQAVEAERELEAMLDVDLSRTDAREAIYLAGMANLDEAAAVLRRWGYDM